MVNSRSSLHKKCPYLEFLWSVLFRVRTEYGELRSISLYSVQMCRKYGPEKLRIHTLFMQWLSFPTINLAEQSCEFFCIS